MILALAGISFVGYALFITIKTKKKPNFTLVKGIRHSF